ncbi:invasion associated locus B family protein [Hyphobacterium sp. HN65]|uniref:Invasion associated locus B family protein n=1 Tax=Hyphobacterium lacteum TaxID=3116575 RepID=A0ABU7LRN1_9PROT|nr:invasion associated locus B family protein [Hyphobacterium sp. HN65]MEE2526571.1 invasion associated locus B family protein [Hyphobacterium sp. HN65]
MRKTVCVLALIGTISSAGFAQEAQNQGAYGDWVVLTRETDDGRVCFAVSEPQESSPSNVDHGSVFFVVSSWANGAADEQPRFIAGYALRPETPPRVRIGSSRFQMFAAGQDGFVEDLDDEGDLIREMRRGATMRIEATSQRGTATSYLFSLQGVTAALQRVNALC